MRVLMDRLDLGVEALDGVERIGIVIGHIDDRGDTTGNRGARRRAEARQAAIAAGMGLAIHDTGEYPAIAVVFYEPGAGTLTLADGRNPAIRNSDPAILDHAIGQHQCASDETIK